MNIRLLTLSAAICLLPQLAQAQPMQPGLWEIGSNNLQVNGQALPNLDQLLVNLPAEQRQMAEQAMAKEGVAIAGQGVRVRAGQDRHYSPAGYASRLYPADHRTQFATLEVPL